MSADGDRVVVIGTAGHVDHGKSALVRALTGTEPDRLAEERARGLTIDLGFAHRRLEGRWVLSFVDVPGHEDFIGNMLAGAGGVDAALLVIAADEGPMPQTDEHVAILHLLGLERAVVAMTKRDLVEDDWLALVREEAEALIADSRLAGAPIVAVSAHTGAGLERLVAALTALADRVPPAPDLGRPRLSIDRAFTLSGFGTVVTGTLRDGVVTTGDTLQLHPTDREVRVRGLQSHGEDIQRARPGTRAALNIVGVDTDDIARGDVLGAPDVYRPTRWLDVSIEWLPAAPTPLEHDARLHLFHGAAEVPVRVRLIGTRAIMPGGSGYAQLQLAGPTVVVAGDRFVLRRPSPPLTVGGGVVLDPRPARRRRRFRRAVGARFDALAAGDPEDVAWHMLAAHEPCPAAALPAVDTGLEPQARDTALAALEADGRARQLKTLWITDRGWTSLRQRATSALRAYHARHPLRVGMPPEELRERLDLSAAAFGPVVAGAQADGWLDETDGQLHTPDHTVRFDADTQAAVERLKAAFRAAPFQPPSAREAEEMVGQEVLDALVAQGEIVATSGGVPFDRPAFEALQAGVLQHIEANEAVTVADVRDRFDTSRKYALALLEHLDRLRVTRRVGDSHVRGTEPPGAGR